MALITIILAVSIRPDIPNMTAIFILTISNILSFNQLQFKYSQVNVVIGRKVILNLEVIFSFHYYGTDITHLRIYRHLTSVRRGLNTNKLRQSQRYIMVNQGFRC